MKKLDIKKQTYFFAKEAATLLVAFPAIEFYEDNNTSQEKSNKKNLFFYCL